MSYTLYELQCVRLGYGSVFSFGYVCSAHRIMFLLSCQSHKALCQKKHLFCWCFLILSVRPWQRQGFVLVGLDVFLSDGYLEE